MKSLPVEKILSVTDSFGVTRVRVFGSYARGEALEDSDLDLLVDVPRGTSILEVMGIEQELERILGINVEVVTEGDLHPMLRDTILAEARPLVAA